MMFRSGGRLIEAMTIDEAINHFKEMADKKATLAKMFKTLKDYGDPKSTITSGADSFQKKSEEYGQIAKWLEELKTYRGIGASR